MSGDSETRFGGIKRLYGAEGLQRLQNAHVAVIGVGGVGSWAVEALARSAIGSLTLVDLDEVCVSNINRQLPALDGEIGSPKIEVLARRARLINPQTRIETRQEFFTAETADSILSTPYTYVLDAIDVLDNKALLIAECRRRNLPVITSGAAGGKTDATAARIADLSQAGHDPLLQKLRKRLRAEHNFPTDPKTLFNIPCVFSPEPATWPEACETGLRMDCNSGYGAVTFVTGTFGFTAAGHIVNAIAQGIKKE